MNRWLGRFFDRLSLIEIRPPMWLQRWLRNIATFFWKRHEERNSSERV